MPSPDPPDAEAIERLARSIHRAYLASRLAEGAELGAPPLVGWEALPEHYRAQNRDAAEDLPVKLGRIGVALVRDGGDGDTLSCEDLERLAESEHERWARRQAASGRDHPSMRPYAELPESEKRKDRESVLAALDAARRAGWVPRRTRASDS